jgi:hypothetical protein
MMLAASAATKAIPNLTLKILEITAAPVRPSDAVRLTTLTPARYGVCSMTRH